MCGVVGIVETIDAIAWNIKSIVGSGILCVVGVAIAVIVRTPRDVGVVFRG